MIVAEIKLFELLKAKIGEKEAEAFVEILETKVDQKFEDTKNTLVTKGDLKEEIANVRTEIANTKVEIIKWLVSIAIALGGLIIAAAKFIK